MFNRCREVQAHPDGYLDLWAREHYKDLACTTPVLTANRGWVLHRSLQPGDSVFSPGGKPVRVIATTATYFDSDCYEVEFSDGAKVIAGAGHLWRLRQKHKRRVSGTEERVVSFSEEIACTQEIERRISDGRRVDVGVAGPLEYPVQQLPVHPYVLGAWLGDGHSADGRLTASDAEIFERIAQLGFELSDGSRPITRTIYGLRPRLRALALLKNKHIPQIYMTASIHQRFELLRGLMDTDGHCNTRGTATYVSRSPRLAQHVYELAGSLALRPRIREYQQRGAFDGYRYWQVSFQAHQDANPFHLKRKAVRAIPSSHYAGSRTVKSVTRVESVPTNCIQVEGGMYLAGRELVPAHNSTIITFALTLQDILNDPELTVGLLSHTRPIAKQFLRQLKQEFELNERLKHWFPDVLWSNPQKEAPLWSMDEGIVLRRQGNPKEATIEAWGLVDGQPTSKHYRLMVYDDVVTRESVTTPDMIKKVTGAWELSRNLSSEGGRTRYVGTRYHYKDTYAEMIERGIAPRVYAATVDGTAEGEPVFMSRERLKVKLTEMQDTFAAQMLLQPRLDRDAYFKREWFHFYSRDEKPCETCGERHRLPAHLHKYGASDYAVTSQGGDWTVHGVCGVDKEDDLYIIDWWRGQTESHLWIEEFLNMASRHRHGMLCWGEEDGQIRKSLGPFIDKRQRERKVYMRREPFPSVSDKATRCRSFQARASMGKVFLPYDAPWVFDLVSEMLMFPFGDHDDQVDVLGMFGRMLDQMTAGKVPAPPPAPMDRWRRALAEREGGSGNTWKVA